MHPLIPPIGQRVHLKDYDPDEKGDHDKDTARKHTDKLQDRLEELQEMLYAQSRQSLLIVLQAMDAGGKDGTIEAIFEGINPQGVRVTSFKAPTDEELRHDFLWRIHQHTPPRGYIGVFNRSHYEDVLIVRVNKLVPEQVWSKRYEHINAFEKLLHNSGTRVLKFYLHISKDEQRERFQSRLDDPKKHWKFASADLAVREKWDAYMKAYEDALTNCNTAYAPWHIIPANRKWYRNLLIMQTIVETLESMGLAYPPAEKGLDSITIPD